MRILIVEDDKTIALLLQRIMEPYSTEISIVGSLADADAWVHENPPADIITLDLNLPDSLWDTTLAKIKDIKARAPNTLIFVVSGVLDPDDMEKASIASGADGYIRKDEDFSRKGFIGKLVETISSIMKRPERTRHSRILGAIIDKLSSAV